MLVASGSDRSRHSVFFAVSRMKFRVLSALLLGCPERVTLILTKEEFVRSENYSSGDV